MSLRFDRYCDRFLKELYDCKPPYIIHVNQRQQMDNRPRAWMVMKKLNINDEDGDIVIGSLYQKGYISRDRIQYRTENGTIKDGWIVVISENGKIFYRQSSFVRETIIKYINLIPKWLPIVISIIAIIFTGLTYIGNSKRPKKQEIQQAFHDSSNRQSSYSDSITTRF